MEARIATDGIRRYWFEQHRLTPAEYTRKYTTRQIRYFYFLHVQAQLEAQDRQQLAVFKAISSSLAGTDHHFASAVYQFHTERDGAPIVREFPYDCHFLTPKELSQIQDLSKQANSVLWTPDRLHAAKGSDLIAKRAAQSNFLFNRYQDKPDMSLQELKLWHDVELLENMLTPQVWFVTQHLYTSASEIKALWHDWLGDKKKQLEDEHRAVIQKLMMMQ